MKPKPFEFYSLFDRYHDRLKRFVMVTVKDAWIADDILQEAFCRAQQRIETLADKGQFAAWLFRIAYRLCLDHFRQAGREKQEAYTEDVVSLAPEPLSAEKQLLQHQMSLCVQTQTRRLPESYRTVIWLFDVLGFTLQETAAILGISLENTKVRLHRGRRKLREILKQNCTFGRDARDVLVCEPRPGLDWAAGGGRLSEVLPEEPLDAEKD